MRWLHRAGPLFIGGAVVGPGLYLVADAASRTTPDAPTLVSYWCGEAYTCRLDGSYGLWCIQDEPGQLRSRD